METARHSFSRISLTMQVVIVIVLVSFVVWALLNRIQTLSLRKIFQQQLSERLSHEALEDRLKFDRYIKAHSQLVNLLVSQKKFVDHIEGEQWMPGDNVKVQYHKKPTPWLPRLSAFHTFTRPRHALLMDAEGVVREVYQSGDDRLPESLLRPGGYLLEQSRGQSFLTTLDETPYLVTSERATDSSGQDVGTLILASPIDDEFLIDSQGIYSGRLVAILMGSNARIATSSNFELLPAGSSLEALQDRFIVTGQEDYEYGDSELALKFASFISTEEVESLTSEIVSKDKRLRAMLTLTIILFFTAIITVITRKAERLTRRMIDHYEKVFTEPIEKTNSEKRTRDRDKSLEQRVQDQVARLERVGRLKRFLSPQIAELVLAHDAENPLKAHRREVTVVFLDLRGFTAFAGVSEPEEVMSVLHEFHTDMGRIILEHEGTIEHFAGDGIMIIFNDPIEMPNHSERAVRMAVAMREKVVDLRGKWLKLGYQLDCGFGIARGYATIGAIGFEGRWDYNAIGTVTNLASRLCDEAKGGQILISKKVLSNAEDLIETEPLEPLKIKGFSQPVSAFSVIRLTQSESKGGIQNESRVVTENSDP